MTLKLFPNALDLKVYQAFKKKKSCKHSYFRKI